EDWFLSHNDCAVIGFRIYWGKKEPIRKTTYQQPYRVQGFVGCGHAWRMAAWHLIPDYPEWFQFYGEEDFASWHLFLANWSVDFVPGILIQHRVDLKERKKQEDYKTRLRRALR